MTVVMTFTVRLGVLFLAAACTCTAQAAESEIANRNLGLTPKVLEKAKAAEGKRADDKRATQELKKIEPVKEEITVYGQEDPQDYRKPAKAPLVAFADRLDRSRNLTPAQKAKMVLSFFLGGPMPETEPSAEARTLSRSENAGSPMERPRGALQ